MSKRQLITILAIWVMVFLFLGFPFFWDKIIAVITGLCIIIAMYSTPKVKIPKGSGSTNSSHNSSYVEHRGVPSTDVVRPIINDSAMTS